MISLQGHAALVTGGTLGVGRAIAVQLAKCGADIVLHGLKDDASAQEAVQEIRALGVRCELMTGDLSGPTEDAVENVFCQATATGLSIDLLMSNAGTYSEGEFLEMDFATFDRTMKLNVYSHFFLIQNFARHWIKQGINGRVLLTGSINGRLAEQTHAAYDTSKGAVEMMVRTLAVTLAPHNIRVNGMAPGLVRTPLTAPALDQPDDGDLNSFPDCHDRVFLAASVACVVAFATSRAENDKTTLSFRQSPIRRQSAFSNQRSR